jgi:hypothetical protein
MESEPDDNDSQENAASCCSEDKQKKLELNRAAAMRSRMKKKMEIERLQGVVFQLSQSKELLDLKLDQYEQLLQQSYRDNAMMKTHMAQALAEQEKVRRQMSYSEEKKAGQFSENKD